MEIQKLDDLKVDFLMSVQTNLYDKAYSISREILVIDPKNQLIKKFSKFLN